MDRETELPASDLRLLAAELTEDEFVGELQIHKHTGIDFLDAYRGAYGPTFSKLPCHPLIRPREGYTLHYDSARRKTPLVFLGYKGELIGVFESDNLTVDEDHQRNGLGSDSALTRARPISCGQSSSRVAAIAMGSFRLARLSG